jgi:hypothetical protein
MNLSIAIVLPSKRSSTGRMLSETMYATLLVNVSNALFAVFCFCGDKVVPLSKNE